MSETVPQPGSAAWYAQVEEPVIAAEQPLVDPHHHFWLPEHDSAWGSYELDDLWADTGSGHRVVKTVFIECHAHYRTTGPERLRPVGETEWVAGIAGESAAGTAGQAVVGGIVSFADLRLGERLGEVLDAHEEAGAGLFRGIRHAGARHPQPDASYSTPAVGAPAGLFLDSAFQEGVRLLGRRGYTYESWHYHTQQRDYRELALAAPDTTIYRRPSRLPARHRAVRRPPRGGVRRLEARYRRAGRVLQRVLQAGRPGAARQRLRPAHRTAAAHL